MDHEPVIVVTRRWPTEVEQELRRRYPAVRLSIDDRPLGPEGLRQALEHADAVLPTVSDALPAELFSENIRTRFIGNFGVGVDHIDTDAAHQAGVVVTNTPGVLTDATAELTLALLLMTARRTSEGERQVRSGAWTGWRPTHLMGTQLRGKTLGIIGLGRIGAAVARRAHFGFEMPVSYYHPSSSAQTHDLAIERTGIPDLQCHSSVEDLLETADCVTLHAPGGGTNIHLLDAMRLKLMKDSAFLINTARGDLVDTAALVEALKANAIAGVGLDVYEGEPDVSSELLELENVTSLPHIGSATHEARRAMGMLVIDNLQAYLDGTQPPCEVV